MSWLKAVIVVLLLVPAWSVSGQIKEEAFPLFRDDLDRDSLRRAIDRSLEFLSKIPPDRSLGELPRKFSAQEIKESLVSFTELLDSLDRPSDLLRKIQARFDLYAPSGDPGADVLFTGYYEPVIEGRLSESPEFRFPVYGKPKDMIEGESVTLTPSRRVEKLVGRLEREQFVPYFSRHEIDGLGSLKGKGYEIAWVKDPIDLFFLHIQGSGLLRLGDGRLLHLNYDASNGRPYRSIGRVLIDRGKISAEELSMQRLRRYLTDHPEERDSLFDQNESYVFFRIVKDGPLGNLEVSLTPGRSIATDPMFYPKAGLAFVVAYRPLVGPDGNLIGWEPFSRFVLNQDTGGAIRGPKRVDLYFGGGDEAAQSAGYMKSLGRLYFLVKKKPGKIEKE